MPTTDPVKRKEQLHRYYEKNKDKWKEYSKRWYQKHKVQRHARYIANRDEILAKQKIWMDAHPDYSRIAFWRKKLEAYEKMGNRCVCIDENCFHDGQCWITDPRFLTMNHKNGVGRKDMAKQRRSSLVYVIMIGKRQTDDLDLRCAICQVTYEYVRGARKPVPIPFEPQKKR